jgi:tRNA G37 N-methylase Trm5
VAWARLFIGEALLPGSVAVDATAGNGHDTLFLAGAVGPSGRVYAFDIQPAALEATSALLAEANLEDRVELLLADHSFIAELIRPKTPASVGGGFQRAVKSSMDSANIQRGLIPPLNEVSFKGRCLSGPVDAVMFNLGYLPGGDHSTITRPESTCAALRASLSLLAPGGRVSVVVYTGHPGAAHEREAVESLAANLSPGEFSVIKLTFMNRSPNAPVVILVEKAGPENESMASK